MRTAEEILDNYDEEYFSGQVFGEFAFKREVVIKAINEARRECIDECAKKATVEVDKQSILKLKDQIK